MEDIKKKAYDDEINKTEDRIEKEEKNFVKVPKSLKNLQCNYCNKVIDIIREGKNTRMGIFCDKCFENNIKK